LRDLPLNFIETIASKFDRRDMHTDRKIISQGYFFPFRKKNGIKNLATSHVDSKGLHMPPTDIQYTDQEMIPARNARNVVTLAEVCSLLSNLKTFSPQRLLIN
jgi:hypothetical protein